MAGKFGIPWLILLWFHLQKTATKNYTENHDSSDNSTSASSYLP